MNEGVIFLILKMFHNYFWASYKNFLTLPIFFRPHSLSLLSSPSISTSLSLLSLSLFLFLFLSLYCSFLCVCLFVPYSLTLSLSSSASLFVYSSSLSLSSSPSSLTLYVTREGCILTAPVGAIRKEVEWIVLGDMWKKFSSRANMTITIMNNNVFVEKLKVF